MIRRTIMAGLAGFFLVSCASVAAKQPASIEPIEGFTPAAAVITDATALSAPSPAGSAIARQHRGPVTALSAVPGTDGFFSAGKDGFLTFHRPEGDDETWQISDIPLKLMSVHPDGNLVAVYETDGFSIHRVSVWNWKERTRLYAKRFRDSVVSVSWSARGTWLMVGNTSLDGLTILDGSTGNPATVFAKAPGIVTLGVTGKTETSMITFGPSGRILYTDIASGAERASYPGPQDLDSPMLLRNNLAIAGYRDGAVLLVDATSGRTIASWLSGSPVMATSASDQEPVWLEESADATWVLRKGGAKSVPFAIPDGMAPTSALGLGDRVAFGTGSGKIYTIPALSALSGTPPEITQLADSEIQSIDDIVSDGSRLFLLSKGSVFISSGPGKAPVFAFSGLKANRFALVGESLVFWSNESAAPVVLSGFDGETRRTLYEPTDKIISLTANGSRIALVEGTSLAVVLGAADGKKLFSYSGAGLQDAVLTGANRLVVSRSSTIRAPQPLVSINIKTEETVPLTIDGELCYGLKAVSDDDTSLAGFFVKADESASSTELVTFTLDQDSFVPSRVRIEASYADEDLAANLLVDDTSLFTNLGKGSLVSIGRNGTPSTRFVRGYALPLKSAVMDQFVITLNHDGSLTWFERATGDLMANSAITEKGFWLEQ